MRGEDVGSWEGTLVLVYCAICEKGGALKMDLEMGR
jgi:hypothetical protein